MCNICNLLICVPVQYGMKGIDQQKRSSLNAYCHLCTWRNFSLQLAIIEKATTLLTTPFPPQIKNKAPLASKGSQTPSSVSFFRSTALLAIMQFQLQLNWNNIFLFRFRSAACDISFCLFLSPFAPHHTALQQSIFMQFLSARAEECCRFICLLAFSLSLSLTLSHSVSYFLSFTYTRRDILLTYYPSARLANALAWLSMSFSLLSWIPHTVTQTHRHSYQQSISARNARTKKDREQDKEELLTLKIKLAKYIPRGFGLARWLFWPSLISRFAFQTFFLS